VGVPDLVPNTWKYGVRISKYLVESIPQQILGSPVRSCTILDTHGDRFIILKHAQDSIDRKSTCWHCRYFYVCSFISKTNHRNSFQQFVSGESWNDWTSCKAAISGAQFGSDLVQRQNVLGSSDVLNSGVSECTTRSPATYLHWGSYTCLGFLLMFELLSWLALL